MLFFVISQQQMLHYSDLLSMYFFILLISFKLRGSEWSLELFIAKCMIICPKSSSYSISSTQQMSFFTSGYSSLKTSHTFECSSNRKVGYSNLHFWHFMSCRPTHSSIWIVNTLKSTISPHSAQGIRSKGFDLNALFLIQDLVKRLEHARVWMSRHRVIIFVPQRLQGLVSYCIQLYKKYHLFEESVISFLVVRYLGLGVFYDFADDVLTRLLLPCSACLIVSHLHFNLSELPLLFFVSFLQSGHLSAQVFFFLSDDSQFEPAIILLFGVKLANFIDLQPQSILTFLYSDNISLSLG